MRKAILVQVDSALLERLDRHAAEWYRGNRSAAIATAVEVMLAQRATHVQRQAQPDPHGGWLPAPRHTADVVADLADRPLTADLMDRG